MHDIQYAFRTFRRAPLATITIISTVALGLGIVAVVFSLLNVTLFRIDEVRDPDELFGVERARHPGSEEQIPITHAQYEAFRRETAVFSDSFVMSRGARARIDGRQRTCTLVSGNFFQVLGITAAMGRTLGSADDERGSGRQVIVLSHGGWERWFDRDPAVVGQTVRINGFMYEIVGVTPNGFRGLSIGSPDFWAPVAMARHFLPATRGKADDLPISIVGRLRPEFSVEAAAAALTVWAAGLPDGERAGIRTGGIRLEPRRGTAGDDPLEVLLFFAPIFFAFGLILLIGCANVANLLLARGMARQREIGIRLSLGASRRRIVRQLLTEGLLMSLAAAALGLVISRLALDLTIYAATTAMSPEMAESVNLSSVPVDWRVVLFLIAGAVTATALFGLAPALRITRLELVRTMRGEITKDARPSRARHRLIGAQVCASTLLLICAAIFLRSTILSAVVDLGVRTTDTLSIELPNEPLRAVVVETVKADSLVAAIGASQPAALGMPIPAHAKAGTADASRLAVGSRFASFEFFAVAGIGLVHGRSFLPTEGTMDDAVAIVSESAARALWPGAPALGRVMHVELEPPGGSRAFRVVGVVRDVRGFRFNKHPPEVVYLPASLDTPGTALTLQVHGDPDQARVALFKRLAPVEPALDEIATLRAAAGLEAYLLGLAFWVSVVLGGLALLLTVSGLFSVLSYAVEQRAREIGVRMALGAPAGSITRLVRSQLMRPAGVGLGLGTALASALAALLLATRFASEVTDVVTVLDPLAYAGSLTCIIAACFLAAWIPARRAARIDPIETLRRD
jgi:predicted permease